MLLIFLRFSVYSLFSNISKNQSSQFYKIVLMRKYLSDRRKLLPPLINVRLYFPLQNISDSIKKKTKKFRKHISKNHLMFLEKKEQKRFVEILFFTRIMIVLHINFYMSVHGLLKTWPYFLHFRDQFIRGLMFFL